MATATSTFATTTENYAEAMKHKGGICLCCGHISLLGYEPEECEKFCVMCGHLNVMAIETALQKGRLTLED